jgi:DNA modification methylase/DNA-directed RNA polymerase subunit RPC12/RpoP
MAKKQQQQKERLFEEKLVPAKGGSGELFDVAFGDDSQPVECLGITFPNDEARRAHFTEKLREKLKDPEFRKLEGFPIGEDEDILALSDPPYYTACPNPFVSDFVRHFGRAYDPSERYERKPLATDVSEGKNDALYNAHGYHTKVPPRAIARYVLHYTKPGDLILDGFCGSGMTGVGAQLAAQPPADFRTNMEEEARQNRQPIPEWGVRSCILSDLSPVASFIAFNYNSPLDVARFEKEAKKFFDAIESELAWMYETRHTDKVKGRINYTVWSEVFLCSECGKEIIYFREALDRETNKIREQFPCPHCRSTVSAKRQLQKKKEQFFDKYAGDTFSRNARIPVLINYSVGASKYEKEPDAADLALVKRVEELTVKDFFPSDELPYAHMTHERVKVADYGVHRFHHFFFPRQLASLSAMWRLASQSSEHRTRQFMQFMVEQCIWGMSVMARYAPTHFSQVNQYLSGVFYVPSQSVDVSPWYILSGKYDRLLKSVKASWPKHRSTAVSVSPCCRQDAPDASIDYIFTDPPFGENIYYADLNQLIETWHRVRTEATSEAIIDKAKKKGLSEYQDLMRESFREYYRVLKPGRWMTVVFHNSHNSVWNAIQEAMSSVGFVVADVRILDKQQSSYRQVTGLTAVKKDLVISAYRPSEQLEERFRCATGTEASAWEFVRAHLRQIPVFVTKGNRVETVAERQDYLLYDRMVAFHVQRGFPVPLSAAEFHAGLLQKFPLRDGMNFLPEQVSEYDRQRMEVQEIEQYQLFVSDEKSAIQWVRQQLKDSPMTYTDLQPLYMQEAQRVWEKHEQPLELRTILEQNFVEESGGTWRVPDPKKEADLEQIRHRALMKEFEQYLDTKGKLKVVRTEALRAGFKEAWQTKDYTTIVQMAKRVPDAVIQEDQALLMYLDNASLMLGE